MLSSSLKDSSTLQAQNSPLALSLDFLLLLRLKTFKAEAVLFVAELFQPHAGDEDGPATRTYGIVRLQTGQGKCLACGKVFSNFHNSRTHFREVHSGDQGDHECHICGTKFRNGRSKANHLMKKHGISQKMLKFAQIVP